MCWFSQNPYAKKANQDIVVYKVLRIKDGKFLSYFQDFEYSSKKVYSIDQGLAVQKNTVGWYLITEGFHSYNEKCYVMPYHFVDAFDIYSPSKDNVLSQYSNFNRNIKGCSVFTKCIIPEGSVYYKNDVEEIVSDKIILTNHIILYDRLKTYMKNHPDNVCITFDDIFKLLKINK